MVNHTQDFVAVKKYEILQYSLIPNPGEQHRRRRKKGDTCKISARDLLLENPLVSGSGEE